MIVLHFGLAHTKALELLRLHLQHRAERLLDDLRFVLQIVHEPQPLCCELLLELDLLLLLLEVVLRLEEVDLVLELREFLVEAARDFAEFVERNGLELLEIVQKLQLIVDLAEVLLHGLLELLVFGLQLGDCVLRPLLRLLDEGQQLPVLVALDRCLGLEVGVGFAELGLVVALQVQVLLADSVDHLPLLLGMLAQLVQRHFVD